MLGISLFLVQDVLPGSANGPLRVRNHFPAHLMFLTPTPDAPDLPGKNRFEASFSIDYSSIFIYEKSPSWLAAMDMEMTVLEISLKYGLSERLSLSANIPFVSMNSGFLDGFLADFHDTLGLPNYGRENRSENDFLYVFKKDGKDWINSRSGGLHPGDIPITLKAGLLDNKKILPPFSKTPATISAALAYTLKLPVGNAERGFGSGKFDHGFFLISGFRKNAFSIYANPGFLLLADPDTKGAEISVNNVFAMLLGGEYQWNDRLSLIAQLNFYTSPFDNTRIHQLDVNSLELGIGFAWWFKPDLNLEFAFCEDLTRSAPDFTVHLRLGYNFGF